MERMMWCMAIEAGKDAQSEHRKENGKSLSKWMVKYIARTTQIRLQKKKNMDILPQNKIIWNYWERERNRKQDRELTSLTRILAFLASLGKTLYKFSFTKRFPKCEIKKKKTLARVVCTTHSMCAGILRQKENWIFMNNERSVNISPVWIIGFIEYINEIRDCAFQLFQFVKFLIHLICLMFGSSIFFSSPVFV